MAQKKKRKAQKKAGSGRQGLRFEQEIAEEILALSSIFAEEFVLHTDGIGFRLSVMPHPGCSNENYASVQLDIRYTAGYPSTPLQLRLSSVTGLSADDTELLGQQLHNAAAAFAQESTVCVFNLVGVCQEFLLDHNDAAKEAARVLTEWKQHEEHVAAEDASTVAASRGYGGSEAEAQSLWHEMQQRMLQQAAQGEVDNTTDPGASIPSNVLGEDLWMFNSGLFNDEGESAFTVPTLNSPVRPASTHAKRFKEFIAVPTHKSLISPSKHKGSSVLLGSSPAFLSSTSGYILCGAGAVSGKSLEEIMQEEGLAGALETAQGKDVLPGTAELAYVTEAASQHQGPARSVVNLKHVQHNPHFAEQHRQIGSTSNSHNVQRLLLPQNSSCSFSNLPKGLQQLLGSHSSKHNKDSRAKHRHGRNAEKQEQESIFERYAAAAAAPIFGDFDSSIIKHVACSDNVVNVGQSNSGYASVQPQPGDPATPTWSVGGEVFQSSVSDADVSSQSDEELDASSSVAQAAHVDESDSGGENGASLKSQLLTGYLLLLAVRADGGQSGAASTTHASVAAEGLSCDSSSSAKPLAATGLVAPASLLPLADHLLQCGLLSKWVHWLLQQLPQRPELFQRAFTRLFQQEILQCSSWQSGPLPAPGAVVKQFWDRQIQSTATAAAESAVSASGSGRSAAAVQAALATAPAAAGSIAQVATASVLSAARPPSHAALHSRYRSDFQELQSLGRGGFGIVVAAINRLDGRKYAVKKIKLQPSGGSSYARILREVATLSRLQHPNIVRYFQAWTEEASADGDADLWGESDDGEWGDLGSREGSKQETRGRAHRSTGAEDHSCGETGLLDKAAGTQTAPDNSISTQWASGTSQSSCSSGGDDVDSISGVDSSSSTTNGSTTMTSSSSSHIKGMSDEHEFSIPPHLPPAASPTKQPPPAQDSMKPTKDFKASSRRQHTRSAGPGQILYIQMEFCPRTLAQVLEAGALDEADAWLVLRGILAGLAHIHAQGAIHRDLKPANIFYDSKGEIKLGDFGLAKFNTAAAAGSSSDGTSGDGKTGSPDMSGMLGHRRLSSVGGVASAAAPSDLTGICGTGLYISPEIANGWASYNEKVDLYSLGVVCFEMWHPFGTAMERLAVLRELRETGRMPPGWETAHPQVARLVRWLMSPKPAHRPSAREVLQSDLLPPMLEDEQLKDLLRSLPDNPLAYERVIDSLFSMSSSKEQEKLSSRAHRLPGSSAAASDGAAAGLYRTGLLTSQQATLPLSELPGAPVDSHPELEDAVCQVLKNVCSVHGAVQLSSTSLGLSHAALPRDAVRFLAPSGAPMALRYEVRYPLAAWFAQQAAMAAAVPHGLGTGGWAGSVAAHQQHISVASALERGLKRFEVCRVNRAGRGGRGLPVSYLQVDFDIIAPAGTGTSLREKLLAEAEVLKVVTQALEALPDLGPYEVRLGHTRLFAAAVAGMCLPPEVTPASVMALLSSAISISAATPRGQGTEGPTAGSGSGAQGLSTTDKPHNAPHGHDTASSSSSTGRASVWAAIRAGLDGLGLDAKPVSRCRQCTLKLPGHLTSQLGAMRSFLHELRLQPNPIGLAAATTAVDELEILGRHLVDWGLSPDYIMLEPLLTPPSEYFGGVLFQVLLRAPAAQPNTLYTSAVAAGGRYDGLLQSLWSSAAASVMPAPGAVGVSINCDKLIKVLLQHGQHRACPGVMQGAVGALPGAAGLQGGRLQTGHCDVLVCAKGGDGMLQLMAELWSGGISATILPREAPSLKEQYEYAHAAGARWLVIVDSKTIGSSQLLRVKSLERKGEDASIHISDVGRFLNLGLSGAQGASRSIATGSGLQASAAGHWGSVVIPAAGISSVSSWGGGQSHGGRLLQKFASDGRLASAVDSADADYDTAGGREREGGAVRELQNGRHRDRRK